MPSTILFGFNFIGLLFRSVGLNYGKVEFMRIEGEHIVSMKMTAVQTAVLMAALTLISKLFGFIREMVMANYYGTSFITDAYAMSFSILTALFGGIIAAISTVYMPLYSKISENKGKKEGDIFTSRVINLLFLIAVFISLAGILFSNQIIAVFASGFDGETAKLASFYAKVLFSYVIFSSVAGILESYLQYRGVFLPQIISGYLISICTVIAIIISSYTSYYYLAFGMLLGYVLRFISIVVISKRRKFEYSVVLKPDKETKQIAVMAIPTFVGSYMLFINQFIDKALASRLSEGSISSLNYAWLLNGMIMGVTITVLSTLIYPKISQANAIKDNHKFNQIINTGIHIVYIIVLPCSLGAMVYSNLIVEVVYERGAFDPGATAMTSSAFFFYAMGLLFMSVNELMTKAYYSMRDMKTPMLYAGISVIINIILCLTFVQFMAHSGLALATSVASVCNSVLLFTGLRNKARGISLFNSRRTIGRATLSAVLAIGASYLIYTLLDSFIVVHAFQLMIAILVAGTIYLGLLIMFKVDEVKLLRQIMKY